MLIPIWPAEQFLCSHNVLVSTRITASLMLWYFSLAQGTRKFPIFLSDLSSGNKDLVIPGSFLASFLSDLWVLFSGIYMYMCYVTKVTRRLPVWMIVEQWWFIEALVWGALCSISGAPDSVQINNVNHCIWFMHFEEITFIYREVSLSLILARVPFCDKVFLFPMSLDCLRTFLIWNTTASFDWTKVSPIVSECS